MSATRREVDLSSKVLKACKPRNHAKGELAGGGRWRGQSWQQQDEKEMAVLYVQHMGQVSRQKAATPHIYSTHCTLSQQ